MRAFSVRLEAADYDRLEAEAKRLGLPPATLVRLYVRAGLSSNTETEAAGRRRAGLAALSRLAALTADLPPVNAVQLARESRRELEQRPRL
jgi:hypothetical protein